MKANCHSALWPASFLAGVLACPVVGPAQPLGQPDHDQPGDAMIQAYLRSETEKLESDFLPGVTSAEDWQKRRPEYKQEYFYMLGLWPQPEKTPLQPKVTGHIDGQGYRVELLHYQSLPHLYVTANLFRPSSVATTGERLPAVLYVCGHYNEGRNGNKTACQSHGIWFARHGYICLVLDSLQLGEIAAIHHGTYREGRWWWQSRGYTPAGVECWNGMRGIDYLIGLPEVDPDRIAVTGISGGGAATYWIACADERVKVAVPVSGMADLMSYVPNRVINGHCDCMFLYNTFAWPWTRIAGLIAPRPLLFVNSDHDDIFPMDANERVINRLKRLYSLFGASDEVESVVSVGGHAYRKDIRQAVYRFINSHLKNDPRVVLDSEVDLVAEKGNSRHYPISPEKLRVFPTDSDIPKDELNTRIDEYFVPITQVSPPTKADFDPWRKRLLDELHRVTFRYFPERIPPATVLPQGPVEPLTLETEPGILVHLPKLAGPGPGERPSRVLLVVARPTGDSQNPGWTKFATDKSVAVFWIEPRGVGKTRWTRKNPPNYVERSEALLGRTVDTGRVWDVAAAARFLYGRYKGDVPVTVVGEESAGVLASYAALFEPEIAGVILEKPVLRHMDPAAPTFLNVLRVCDVPEVLGMLAPRPLAVYGGDAALLKKVSDIYSVTGAAEHLTLF